MDQVTHSGGDLDTAMTMARGHLPQDVAWEIDDLLQNRLVSSHSLAPRI